MVAVGQESEQQGMRFSVLMLTFALGLYWAWASCSFFSFAPFFAGGDLVKANETVHWVSLGVCALVTLAIPFVPPAAWRHRKAMTIGSCALAVIGTVLVGLLYDVGEEALVAASVVLGGGEALSLWCLCQCVNVNAGSRTVLMLFSGALVVSGCIYAVITALDGLWAFVLCCLLPVGMAACSYLVQPTRLTSNFKASSPCEDTASPPTNGGKVHGGLLGVLQGATARRFPWSVVAGFSIFGIAFGLCRGASYSDAAGLSAFFAVHEGCRFVAALLLLLVAWRAKNPYRAVVSLGVVAFALGFLCMYGVSSDLSWATVACVTAGYTCFELLMWCIVFEIASEARMALRVPYGFGRGLMQVGIAAGTMLVMGLQIGGLDEVIWKVSQTSIVAMLVLMLTLFSDRDISDLWGVQKATLPEAEDDGASLTAILEERFGLSPRECEVAALLTRGRSEPYIAETLFLSRSTVHSHIVRVYAKMDVHSRQEFLSLVESAMK